MLLHRALITALFAATCITTHCSDKDKLPANSSSSSSSSTESDRKKLADEYPFNSGIICTPLPKDKIVTSALSPDDNILLVYSLDKQNARFFNMLSGEDRAISSAKNTYTTKVAFSSNGQCVAMGESASNKHTLKVYAAIHLANAFTKTARSSISPLIKKEIPSAVSALSYNFGDSMLAAGFNDGSVHILNTETESTEIFKKDGSSIVQNKPIKVLRFANKNVLYMSFYRTLVSVDMRTKTTITDAPLHHHDITALTTDAATLVTGDANGVIKIWDHRRNNVDPIKIHITDVEISALAIRPHYQDIWIGNKDGVLGACPHRTADIYYGSQEHCTHTACVSDILTTSDGSGTITASHDGTWIFHCNKASLVEKFATWKAVATGNKNTPTSSSSSSLSSSKQ